jgi:aryl-alcohol dehydrogenase-like predicted oxidoreductase
MQKRQLGRSALQVAPLVFGGNVFGWTIDEAVSFQLLDAFAASGFNCVDTADVYSRWAAGNSGGESEAIIGKWMKLRGNRDKIIVATKVGSDMGQGKNITKKYILTAANDSLKRLKTDYIDLYQTHFDDDITPVEETLEAYAELIRAGKIRVIGASNLSPARLKASLEASVNHGYPRYESFQPHYNLVEREIFEKELEPICAEHGLGVINYWALAAGFLTGKYRTAADLSKSPRGSGVKKYLNARGLGVLKALDEVAERYHSTPASVAIAWLIARPSVTAPIASATSIGQLDSLIAATKLELDAGAIKLLDAASAWR